MKHFTRWCACVALASSILLGTASVSEAGGRSFPKPKPKPKTIYTAIASVDTAGMTITTETKNAASTSTKTFKISPRVVITFNGQPGTLADLKPGLQIRVGAGMDAGVADEISATNPPPDPK